jgi:hypothetical protein
MKPQQRNERIKTVTTRSDFLRNLRKTQVKLHPVQLDGWDMVVYLRPQTLGEIRDILMKADPDDALKKETQEDPLFIARNVARLVRDENGVLLFNEDDAAQMKELMGELESSAPIITRQLNQAYTKLNEPSPLEVTPKGNSPSAKTS